MDHQIRCEISIDFVDLLAWLSTRGPNYESAFAEPGIIRVALDQKHVAHDVPLGAASEAALFPPMTGG